MHALWALVGTGSLEAPLHEALLKHEDPVLRAWGVRAAGNFRSKSPQIVQAVTALADDPNSGVRLQVAIAAVKLNGEGSVPLLLKVLAASEGDKLIPQIVWQNLQPLIQTRGVELLTLLAQDELARHPAMAPLIPRLVERILGTPNQPALLMQWVKTFANGPKADRKMAGQTFATLAVKIQTREITGAHLDEMLPVLREAVAPFLVDRTIDVAALDAARLAATLGDPAGRQWMRRIFLSEEQPLDRRSQALEALIGGHDTAVRDTVTQVLADSGKYSTVLRNRAIEMLGRLDDPWVATVVLQQWSKMEPELQPAAINLLTQRPAWAHDLLDAIARQQVPRNALAVNQLRKLYASPDDSLVQKVKAQWGTLRTTRNPDRERVIGEMRILLARTSGNAPQGEEVFHRVCGQCHKIYGRGQDVGPDLTSNGRSSFEQLLSNVFDPSLVIGAAYQARTVVTTDGQLLTGLTVEDNEQRVVLRVQGGRLEVIPRDEIEEVRVSQLSLMPEELEKQFKPQEIADLFAFLKLDKSPSDPSARQLPEMRNIPPQASTDTAKFNEILSLMAPGFTTTAVGERGLAILAEHMGRASVLRTHPVSREIPCVLSSTIDVPAGKRTRLSLAVSHHSDADWQLVVRIEGKTVFDEAVGPKTSTDGWRDVRIDLTPWAGQSVKVEMLNQASGWYYEFGYWGRIDVKSE